MFSLFRTIACAALLIVTVPVAAQQPRTTAPLPLPTADDGDDIVVSALRIPRDKLPTGVYWNYESILVSRVQRENADMFMRCALKLSSPGRVRAVVDGEPNSAPARFAQARLSAANRGCYPPSRSAGFTGYVASNSLSPVSSADVIDRGAIYERVLSMYAPDAGLTRDDTQDPAVHSRFNARESVRNRLRLQADLDALVLASCLVREQPVFATRLMRSEAGSLLERGLTQAMFVEGRQCTTGAKLVTVNPTFFRSYIADAFYRWVVAARDIDSLVPKIG